ncbi:DUF86 domain-containing protein [Burkholderia ambifaria]|uniref:HepT-like ribonuclease domain-containing protein n=1 Tax=Burkholderia ambifaria TaxID=152480 RepID=UPI003C7DFC98
MPTPRERCDHISGAVDAIFRDVNGHDERAFLAVDGLQAACYYRLIVIGEASADLARRSGPLIVANFPALTTDLSKAHRLRTRLAHQYHRTDPAIIWVTIQKTLRPFQTDINRLRAILP